MPHDAREFPGPFILDACSVICLEAAGILRRVLAILPGDCLIASSVVAEAQWVYSWPAEDGSRHHVAIDLQAHVSDGLLKVVTPQTEAEAERFVQLAGPVMDDGEAMSTAIALHRGATLVTDERIATNYCRSEGIACLSSLDMVQAWALHDQASDDEIVRALTGIAQRARYRPPRSHALFEWWTRYVDG